MQYSSEELTALDKSMMAARNDYNLASIKQAFLAGYNYAQEKAEISEWDGWHRTAPNLVWPNWPEVEKAANEYNQPRA